ncbi:MAG: amino acid permease [Coxiella sp. (in: Bacteria)]|nr:MAG: amino acid permease [Coxiella sp. (in: g-proteobacteria)]
MHKRSISSVSLLFASVSAILGSGWLFAAFYTAQLAGPGAFLAWILGGVAVIVIAFTYAEISAMIPIVGSTARIPRYTHGTFVSYLYSWIIWLSYIALAPTEVQAVIQYLDYFFPHLTFAGGGLTDTGYMTAGILMLAMTTLNLFSIRWLIRCNNVFTVLKIVLPVFLCLVLISLYFTPAKLFHPQHSKFLAYGMHGVLSAISTGGIVFAFNGFKQACEMAGEAKNPARSIPFAVVGSILICLVVYLLLQTALFSALTPANLKHGWAHLSVPGDGSPFAGIVQQSNHLWLMPILYVGAIVGPLAAGLMYISSSARSLFAMSKNDYLPKFFEARNKHGHPWVAVIACFLVGMLTFAPLPGWKNMISFLASLMAASYVITPVCLLALRKQVPDYERPLKLPFVTIWATVAFYFCNLLSYWSGWYIISKLDICLVASLVLLFAYHYGTERGRLLHLDFKTSVWIWPYFSGMALISYLGSFGGGRNIIPFGWDMVVLFVFSCVIMWLAVKYCLPAEKTKRYLDKLKHLQETH